VVNKNFLVELIDEHGDMYVEDEHDSVLNVLKANMMILINRLRNQSDEDNLKSKSNFKNLNRLNLLQLEKSTNQIIYL
jgi:hypothetical protein